MTYVTKPETKPGVCTIDPSILQLIKDLAQALQMHHLGLTTTEPFARTYERDQSLLNQSEDFLMIAQGRTQSWRINPREYRPPGTGPK